MFNFFKNSYISTVKRDLTPVNLHDNEFKHGLFKTFHRRNKRKARRIKNFRFIFRRYRFWRWTKVALRSLKINQVFFRSANNPIRYFIKKINFIKRGVVVKVKTKFRFFRLRKRSRFKKYKRTRYKKRMLLRRTKRIRYRSNFKYGNCNLNTKLLTYNYNAPTSSYIYNNNVVINRDIWVFSKYLGMHSMFSFNMQYNIKFTRLFRNFVDLYFTLNTLYKFSRNRIFKSNRFGIVYGVTYLIFFKSFFYLDLAFNRFFRSTIYKRHRLLLIALRRLLNVKFMEFYKTFGFYGCEILFFGKLGGFGGSKKKRYKISFGFRSSMSSNYRVHQYLHEYFTLHGRIGSKCKVTLLN